MTRHGWTALAGASALMVAGTMLGYRPLMIIGSALGVAVLLAVAWVSLGGTVSLERRIDPDRVEVGQSTTSFVTVTNRTRRLSLPLPVEDRAGRTPIALNVPTLAPGAGAELSYEPSTGRRGIIQVGPLRSMRGDPWGLIVRERSHGDTATLLVVPRHQQLRPLPPSVQRSLEAPTTDSSASGTQTFHQLRDYVVGDDRRMIHWRSYARTGNLVVRQHVDTSLPELAVVLDLRPGHHTDESFEQAIEIVASLMVVCAHQNFPAQLHLTDGRVIVAPPGSDAANFFLDQLAGVEIDPEADQDADLSRLVQAAASSVAGHRLTIVTGRPSDADMSSIAVLGRRCSHVLVVDADPIRSIPSRPGLVVVAAPTSEDFADLWNRGQLN